MKNNKKKLIKIFSFNYGQCYCWCAISYDDTHIFLTKSLQLKPTFSCLKYTVVVLFSRKSPRL